MSTPLEAAKKAASDFGLSGENIDAAVITARRRENDVMRNLEDDRIREEKQLCSVIHRASEIAAGKDMKTAWDDPEFLLAMDALCYAQDRLAYTLPFDIYDYAEERLEEVGSNEPV